MQKKEKCLFPIELVTVH